MAVTRQACEHKYISEGSKREVRTTCFDAQGAKQIAFQHMMPLPEVASFDSTYRLRIISSRNITSSAPLAAYRRQGDGSAVGVCYQQGEASIEGLSCRSTTFHSCDASFGILSGPLHRGYIFCLLTLASTKSCLLSVVTNPGPDLANHHSSHVNE